MNDTLKSVPFLQGTTKIQDIVTPEEVETQDWVAMVNKLLEEKDQLIREKNELTKEHQLQQIRQGADLERANSLATRYLSRLMKIDAEYFGDTAQNVYNRGIVLGDTAQKPGSLWLMSTQEIVNTEFEEAA